MTLPSELLELVGKSPTLLLTFRSGKILDDILEQGVLSAEELASTVRTAADIGDADTMQDILYDCSWKTVLEIILHDADDLTVSTDLTLTGINRYNNVTVDSGITLTMGGQPSVLICNKLLNDGTISKTATGGDGGAPFVAPGAGGKGGGGLIIICKTLDNNSTIQANGENGEAGSTTTDTGGGSAGADGRLERIGTDTAGSGGKGGGSYGGAGNLGGGGGGDVGSLGEGGAGGSVTYVDNDNAAKLVEKIKKAAADWWLQNVVGKTPSSVADFPDIYGAGGGGGGDYDGRDDNGGGGGSGGEIIILCSELDNTGTIEANGGTGGNGGTEGDEDAGGGGGGGGIVYALYETLTNEGTLRALGGAGGTGDHNGNAGTDGTARAIAI